ncbi:hypothetical protein GCM10020358_55520 [Amorphoplanes nipponensis]|uniref:Uncharacterized protein n=1 Tax=Actinoplanes nipponensis TaxID=135950 RepID=A0A919MR09_9ACTN|nr:hypothetical protein [Actinoplanes nipponensis]GIE54186.1 hypothetical protein Ani05nite_77200 [Actinoplanes nipponensis]
MGFPERHSDQHRPAGAGATRPARPEDRYGTKPGPRPGGSHEPLFEPAPVRRSNLDPVGLPTSPLAPPAPAPAPPAAAPVDAPAAAPAVRPAARSDLTTLLGRTVLEARVQQICREYGLIPRSGEAVGSGLSRSYLSRDAGVELAADAHGMVTTVFLHFHGDDGFAPFQGEIPGGAGSDPRRSSLWATLGRPGEQGDPYRDRYLGDYGPWDRWVLAGFALHAQYGVDGERLERITLTRPDRRPRAA